LRYAIRNALLPQLTALALALGNVVSGAVLVEVIFQYPGVGALLYQSIRASDFYMIQGLVFMIIVAIGLATLMLDLLYPLLAPRISYARNQGRRHLTLIRMTPDLIYDQLIGMGCADKLVFSWVGNPGVGSLHRFRDAYENGWPAPIAIEEHSHAAMANAYEAGAAGLPFAVFRGYL